MKEDNFGRYSFLRIDVEGLDDYISIPLTNGLSLDFFGEDRDYEYPEDWNSKSINAVDLVDYIENKDLIIKNACADKIKSLELQLKDKNMLYSGVLKDCKKLKEENETLKKAFDLIKK